MVLQAFGAWAVLNTAADYPRAAALADQILDLAGREGSHTSVGFAHLAQMEARFYAGDPLAAEGHFSVFSEFVQTADGFRRFPGAVVITKGYASVCAWTLGHADLARERIAQAITFAADSENPYDLGIGRFFESWLYCWLRDRSAPRLQPLKP